MINIIIICEKMADQRLIFNVLSSCLMVFYSQGEEHLVSRAVKAGIAGFLHKETDMDKLAVLVRAISLGGCYINSAIIYRIFSIVSELDRLPGSAEEIAAFQREKKRIYGEFSPTERSIISLIAQGYPDSEIADDLHINRGTVRNNLCAIRRKTGLQNRIQIAIYALKYGLISFNQISGAVEAKKTIDRLAPIPYNKQNGGSHANRMRNRSGNPELQAGHL